MASLALTDDELRRLAHELAGLIVAALPAREQASAWLDTKAAAAYAGCSVPSLHKAMGARQVRFTQEAPGGKAWFKREWIDSWRGL